MNLMPVNSLLWPQYNMRRLLHYFIRSIGYKCLVLSFFKRFSILVLAILELEETAWILIANIHLVQFIRADHRKAISHWPPILLLPILGLDGDLSFLLLL
jgi:hypothetical protein